METTKTKTFDAVAESRPWKEAIARQTEGMTREQVLTFFSKEHALAAMHRHGKQSCIVCEEPPSNKRKTKT